LRGGHPRIARRSRSAARGAILAPRRAAPDRRVGRGAGAGLRSPAAARVKASRRGLVAALVILLVAIGGTTAWVVGGGRGASAGPPPQFVDETSASGLAHVYEGDFAYVNGAYPIDVDGDGNTDLAVLRNGGNRLLQGLGDCRFEDATAAWGLDPGTRHTEAFSATWENGSGWPTLAFGNYVDPVVYGDATTLDPGKWCEPNELVRPASGGHGFGAPLPLTPSWCTLSLLFSDWSGSG